MISPDSSLLADGCEIVLTPNLTFTRQHHAQVVPMPSSVDHARVDIWLDALIKHAHPMHSGPVHVRRLLGGARDMTDPVRLGQRREVRNLTALEPRWLVYRIVETIVKRREWGALLELLPASHHSSSQPPLDRELLKVLSRHLQRIIETRPVLKVHSRWRLKDHRQLIISWIGCNLRQPYLVKVLEQTLSLLSLVRTGRLLSSLLTEHIRLLVAKVEMELSMLGLTGAVLTCLRLDLMVVCLHH